jgi:hypothetical protein
MLDTNKTVEMLIHVIVKGNPTREQCEKAISMANEEIDKIQKDIKYLERIKEISSEKYLKLTKDR